MATTVAAKAATVVVGKLVGGTAQVRAKYDACHNNVLASTIEHMQCIVQSDVVSRDHTLPQRLKEVSDSGGAASPSPRVSVDHCATVSAAVDALRQSLFAIAAEAFAVRDACEYA